MSIGGFENTNLHGNIESRRAVCMFKAVLMIRKEWRQPQTLRITHWVESDKTCFKLLQERKKARIHEKELNYPEDVIVAHTDTNNMRAQMCKY